MYASPPFVHVATALPISNQPFLVLHTNDESNALNRNIVYLKIVHHDLYFYEGAIVSALLLSMASSRRTLWTRCDIDVL